MEPCLRPMLNQTCHKRRVKAKTGGGSEILDEPVAFASYVEVKRREVPVPGGTSAAPYHVIITEESVTLDDRLWLPNVNPEDLTQGKKPQSVQVFYVPTAPGTVDHYEVTL